MIPKHWNLLAINKSLKEIFNYQLITAFNRNKNLKELIGSNKIGKKDKVKKWQIQKLEPGKFSPGLTILRLLYFVAGKYEKQLLSRVSKPKKYSKTLIVPSVKLYIWRSAFCVINNSVGKAETSFNIRLNNHRKDAKKDDAMIACKHFQHESHNSKKHEKITIID